MAFPNVCKIPPPGPGPPIPTPFPSSASCSSGSDTATKVLIRKKEVFVESSLVKTSRLDEAGTLKGIVSNTNRDQVGFKKYSSKVYAQKKKVVHHTAVTSHNFSNANMPVGCHMTPSQTKVLVGI